MEDKQIIELYWSRSEDAIEETAKKYGDDCAYIANHILENRELVEVCVKECYDILWDNIPPYRPQNLKAYLCKITRNHALKMKYPEINEQEADLFTAELVIHDFLKNLEPEQRKLFVARYWYFALIAEIVAQYKLSEKKVNGILDELRQKLDDVLKEKQVHLQSEAEFLYAMTEVEDRYLEEAAPKKMLPMKATTLEVESEEKHEEPNLDIKNLLNQIPQKCRVPAIVSIVLLVMVFVVLIWPKNPAVQNPTESENSEVASGSENTENLNTDKDIMEDLVSILGGGTFQKNDFAKLMANNPANEAKEIAALPIYKNLCGTYIGNNDFVEYMTEDSLTAMIEDITTKLNMKIISTKFDKVRVGDSENRYAVTGVQVTTDTGSIQINARGKVIVSFVDGVQLPEEYDMSDDTTIEHANNKVVAYLMNTYENIISAPYFAADSYATYDNNGNRTMHFRAIVDGGKISDVENILDYNFNQVEFYYNEGLGLTGFSYGDIRMSTELLGYYQIISLDKAKELLKEGNYKSDYFHPNLDGLSYEKEKVLGVELIYKTDEWEYLYQPFYCFYILTSADNTYARCYVPAAAGVIVDDTDVEIEDMLDQQTEGVDIIHLEGYDRNGWIYYKDGKYYTFKSGKLVETNALPEYEGHFYSEYGDVSGEITDNGTEWILYYKGEEILNLSKLKIPPDGSSSIDAKYIDGQVVVFSIVYPPNSDYTNGVATVYLYSEAEQSLTPIMHSVPLYSSKQPQGLDIKYGRYAICGDDAEKICVVDLLTGTYTNTEFYYDEIESIMSVSDKYFAFVYRTGEIYLIDKVSGGVVKGTKYALNFIPEDIRYQDDMLYVSFDYGTTVFVIKEFE